MRKIELKLKKFYNNNVNVNKNNNSENIDVLLNELIDLFDLKIEKLKYADTNTYPVDTTNNTRQHRYDYEYNSSSNFHTENYNQHNSKPIVIKIR